VLVLVREVGFEPTKAYANRDSILEEFAKFCRVDLRLNEKTVSDHVRVIKKMLLSVKIDPCQITKGDIRDYLAKNSDRDPTVYKNILSGIKRFFRDFMGETHLVEGFKFPRRPIKFKPISSKEELKKFYAALERSRDKAMFLLFATSGLRRNEVLSLSIGDIDFKNRMIKPGNDQSGTKHTWISFFNEEAENILRGYLANRKDLDPRLFPLAPKTTNTIFKRVARRNGISVTPQGLRKWFCSQMGELGVPDRYIDAFCGRVPQSILARHYTDYGSERLKQIYDKAGLKVLN